MKQHEIMITATTNGDFDIKETLETIFSQACDAGLLQTFYVVRIDSSIDILNKF